ncbi:hypothetical protein SPI_02674 [Niveomyces insectorum RCEF 264]|uniref:Uncharacterized protein n=1 Tax=Niveomyces insectorum RCEF 264 TaxID=1081102 RepID=A0A167Y637_9HYPO|nr:hypothetical protein SPI_02674 [Niveomyces insectorum RCEF 264]
MKQVPTITQVIPGAFVHIVLKQDQPTGRTVQGVVQTVLTRGNHPRGIKVRLADGRVGRVQRVGGGGGGGNAGTGADSARTAGHDRETARGDDIRDATRGAFERAEENGDDGKEGEPRTQIGLDAYIRPAKSKQRKRQESARRGISTDAAVLGQEDEVVAPSAQPTTKCPVCGDFEGDELAVSHHVASHFDS